MEDTTQKRIAEMLANGEIGAGATAQAHAVAPIAEHVIRMLRPSVPRQVSLSLKTDQTQPPAAVFMEPIEIQQILIQLLRNARDAQHETPGTIAIAVEACAGNGAACHGCTRVVCGEYVRLQVSDEGPGMDAATLSHVFEPFFTTDAERHRAGLGLSIVNALTHRAGGHLNIVSAKQRGTSIEVWLPGSTAAVHQTPDGPTPDQPPFHRPTAPMANTRPRIWLVNEDLAATLYLSNLLRDEGMVVDSFSDATQCLQAFMMQPQQVDAVIADHDGAALTGPALIRTMLSVRPDVIGIVCVNADQQDHELDARQAGARAVVFKPFDAGEFLQTVRQCQDQTPASMPSA